MAIGVQVLKFTCQTFVPKTSPTLHEKKLKKQFPLSLTQFSGPPPAFGRHAAVRHGALQSHKATSPAPAEHRTTSLISGNVLPCTDFFSKAWMLPCVSLLRNDKMIHMIVSTKQQRTKSAVGAIAFPIQISKRSSRQYHSVTQRAPLRSMSRESGSIMICCKT